MTKKNIFIGLILIIITIAFFSYEYFLFSFVLGRAFPTTDFSTFSKTEMAIPLPQEVTWVGIWDMQKNNSVSFLQKMDLQLKKGNLPPKQSFAIAIIDSNQKEALAKVIDQNELSFMVLIDEQDKLTKILWEWMPKPALLAIDKDGKIIWAGSNPANAPKL